MKKRAHMWPVNTYLWSPSALTFWVISFVNVDKLTGPISFAGCTLVRAGQHWCFSVCWKSIIKQIYTHNLHNFQTHTDIQRVSCCRKAATSLHRDSQCTETHIGTYVVFVDWHWLLHCWQPPPFHLHKAQGRSTFPSLCSTGGWLAATRALPDAEMWLCFDRIQGSHWLLHL